MLRAAAKNFRHVAVVVDPADYALLLEQLDREGGIDAATRLYFAQKAFRHTGRYEAAIAGYFAQVEAARGGYVAGRVGRDLPLSPEPHLREGAGPALRREPAPARGLLQRPRLDALLGGGRAQAAGQGALVQQHPRPRRRLAAGHRARRAGLRDREAHEPVRHRHSARSPLEAYERAWACDPTSAFGGIVAFNAQGGRAPPRRRSRRSSSRRVIAPGFEARGAQGAGAKKANLRVMNMDTTGIHKVGGLRPAPRDGRPARAAVGPAPPRARPLRGGDEAQARRRRSGGRCSSPGRSCKHVKSNAIVLRERASRRSAWARAR